ncbi:GDSL-type esterase/lipase family protein [Microbacterium sp. NRRL B-14842]
MRVTFIGDSITDAGRDRSDPGSFGDGYVSLLAPELQAAGATVRNLGIAGDRARDLAARWDAELTPTAPELLTVYVGVNDMWRRFDSDDPTRPRTSKRRSATSSPERWRRTPRG